MRFVILHVRVTVFITVRVTLYLGACVRAVRKSREAAEVKRERQNSPLNMLNDAYSNATSNQRAMQDDATSYAPSPSPSPIEERSLPSHETKTKHKRPTVDEVAAYCKERGNSVSPQRWYDYYPSNGWPAYVSLGYSLL